jgi:hypothetical protein
MKVLGTTLARAIWVIDMQQLNPTGRSLLDLFHAIAKRYRFSKFPQHLLDYNKDSALEFNSGSFLKSPTEDFRVGLTIYTNGITGDSLSSTDESEAFLQDMAQWAAKEHNLPFDQNSVLRKSYLSQVEVSFESELQLANPKLSFIPSLISAQAVQLDGKPAQYRFGGLTAWSENVGKEGALQPFRLERKYGIPFTENVYFSLATLRTQEHIALLQRIETALQ